MYEHPNGAPWQALHSLQPAVTQVSTPGQTANSKTYLQKPAMELMAMCNMCVTLHLACLVVHDSISICSMLQVQLRREKCRR